MLKNKIETFLLQNTVWVFLIVLFLFNHVWVLPTGYPNHLYLAGSKWSLYFSRTLWTCLLFAPMLLFAGFRKHLDLKLGKKSFRLLWVYCFLIHPFLIGHFNIQNLFIRPGVDGAVLWIWGAIFVGIEMLLFFNQLLLKKLDIPHHLKNLGIEKILLLGLLLFSLLYAYIKQSAFSVNYLSSVLQHFLFFGIFYLFYWVNHYVLIAKIFRQRGIIYYGFSFIGLALIFYPMIALCINYFPVLQAVKVHLGSEYWVPSTTAPTTDFHAFSSSFPLLGMVLSIPFIVVYQWFQQVNEINILEKEKAATELKNLKQQVNPHFLFNTLNSLYALGIEENGEKTADGIAKLGTLMRYNLHDAQATKIELSKEIDYIQKYIELQKLRLTDKNELRLQLPETGMEQQQIAPMLLIPFIENAFKYGISPSENTFIELTISLQKNQLLMTVENSIIKNAKTTKGGGVGIPNAKKRLALLYPNQQQLHIEKEAAIFKIQLTINL